MTTCLPCGGTGYIKSPVDNVVERCRACRISPGRVSEPIIDVPGTPFHPQTGGDKREFKTRIGLIGALDKALWGAIDQGRDAVLLYVRTGGKPDIKVTVEVDRGYGATRDTQVLLEGTDV